MKMVRERGPRLRCSLHDGGPETLDLLVDSITLSLHTCIETYGGLDIDCTTRTDLPGNIVAQRSIRWRRGVLSYFNIVPSQSAARVEIDVADAPWISHSFEQAAINVTARLQRLRPLVGFHMSGNGEEGSLPLPSPAQIALALATVRSKPTDISIEGRCFCHLVHMLLMSRSRAPEQHPEMYRHWPRSTRSTAS